MISVPGICSSKVSVTTVKRPSATRWLTCWLALLIHCSLVLFELGSPSVEAALTSLIVSVHVAGGVSLWALIAGRSRIESKDVVAGVGIGALTFAALSTFWDPVGALAVLMVSCLAWIIGRWRTPSDTAGSADLDFKTMFIERFVLVAAGQMLFLSQLRPKFMFGGVALLLVFSILRSNYVQQLVPSAKRDMIRSGLIAVGLAVVHLFMICTRSAFSFTDPESIFAPDAVTQAAESRSLIEHGLFDSVLMAGVQDRYHWLSWGWAGGLGNLLGGDYWLSTEVLIAGGTAFSFAIMFVAILEPHKRSIQVVLLAFAATMLMDSSLENAPTVDFGGTSGFFGLLALMMLLPLQEALNSGKQREVLATTTAVILFGFLGKVSFGLLILGVIAITGAVEVIRKRNFVLVFTMWTLSLVLATSTYLYLLRPFSQDDNSRFGIRLSIAILGYKPAELIDLVHRVVPLFALLVAQVFGPVKIKSAPLAAVVVGISSLLVLDIRGSGPISFIWSISLFVGLAVATADNLEISWSNLGYALPVWLLGLFITYRVVTLQWLGQSIHQPTINALLWAGFFAMLIPPLISLIKRKIRGTDRPGQTVNLLLAVSVAFCAGSFVVQTMRTEVREIADSDNGIKRQQVTFGAASIQKQDVLSISKWVEGNSDKSDVFASDDLYLGAMVASLSGRRAYVASDHFYFFHPVEVLRRQGLTREFIDSGSPHSRKDLVCSGVTLLVRELDESENSAKSEIYSYRAGRFTVSLLDPDKELRARCS